MLCCAQVTSTEVASGKSTTGRPEPPEQRLRVKAQSARETEERFLCSRRVTASLYTSLLRRAGLEKRDREVAELPAPCLLVRERGGQWTQLRRFAPLFHKGMLHPPGRVRCDRSRVR